MKIKYTPFRVETSDNCDGAIVYDCEERIAGEFNGCDIPGSSMEMGTDEAKAYARLFAAAPAMQNALRAVLRDLASDEEVRAKSRITVSLATRQLVQEAITLSE